ncbi:hypothetical protein EV1_020414 [Malus domestica]
MMFAELGETLLDRNFLVGKGVVSRPVAHDFWPQRRTCKDLWTCLSILHNQDWGSYQDWLILVKEVDCYNLEFIVNTGSLHFGSAELNHGLNIS